MQLIFFYDPYNQDQNTGANFSPEYCFYVTYDTEKCIYTLCQNTDWYGYDIYTTGKNKNIVSVSAVVGENGSGKTTLLQNILGYNHRGIVDDPLPIEEIVSMYLSLGMILAIYICIIKLSMGTFIITFAFVEVMKKMEVLGAEKTMPGKILQSMGYLKIPR